MRIDLYQQEISVIAQAQTALLDEAREAVLTGRELWRLEQNGVLHAFQVLIENAIGKAKQTLKQGGKTVPISAYDSFMMLSDMGIVSSSNLDAWNAAIGLRNRIVHDYMNIDMKLVLKLVENEQYRFVTEFLLMPIANQSTGE